MECAVCHNDTNIYCPVCPECAKQLIQTQRPDWDTYFLQIARVVSSRSTCPRGSVGATIVRDNHILATGYNGAAPGEPHCIDVGCDIQDGHCQRAIHAETNAVAQAAKMGIGIEGATMYYWDSLERASTACIKCTQVMKAAGIKRIVGIGHELCL